MKWVRCCVLAIASAVLAPCFVANLHAGPLGVANEFNGFIFGDLAAIGGDTEGRLAVGGDFVASNYAVASGGVGPAVPYVSPPNDHLVVAGDLNAQGGWQVFNGNAVWGTSLTAAPTTSCAGCGTYQGMPIDFDAARIDLEAKSDYWATLATNASIVYDGFSTLTLTTTHDGLNVFNVSESDWEGTSNKQIVNALYPNATILINIAGSHITQSGGLSYNGSQTPGTAHGNVLFNFNEATTIESNHIAMLGSVLAPYADLTLNGGGINGVGIASSATQVNGGEFHNFTFTGDLPPVVPEPTGLAIAVIGLAVGGMGRRVRR